MTDDRPPRLSRIEYALRREQWAAQGRSDGFKFAADCKGDIARLTADIVEKEELITSLLALPVSPMAPGASPRIYRDAYLAALREAVAMVRKLGREDGEHPAPV